ncbi:MAG: CYTH domain-containing protein [Flavobacteriaceae bacterium]|nr:CYTH domain-containing protein [Flavobacteriaceae bacterium]
MNIEIERKFLVISEDFKKESQQKLYIKQGFLNSHKERTVRVRILNDTGFLTIKGISNKSGTKRLEWEKEISFSEAEQLICLSEKGIIEKYRYLIHVGQHVYEVDEFLNENKGLILAEIELKDEFEPFEKPNWLGKEVTGVAKYYNSMISKNPYKNWVK